MYFMHTITQQQKRTPFASKTAFRSVEATYLYSPDTLWMLTWGKCVEQSSKNRLEWYVHWPRIMTCVCLLVVGLCWFICLHKGAPCISVEVKETENLTESHMHAQWFCLGFYFVKTSDKGNYRVHSRGNIATECLWGVFQTFVAYLSIS